MDVGFSFDNSSLFSRNLCRIGKSFWWGGGGIDFGYQGRMFGGTEDGEALQEEVGPPKKRGGAGDTTKIRVDVMTLVFGMIYMRGSGH